MKFTEQYFNDARDVIMGVIAGYKDELAAVHGRIDESLKPDNSVVTKLDKELEIKFKEALSKFDSSVGFWGEEHGQEGNEKTMWLIDPIDGTESFIRGLPACRNILTFVHDGQIEFALANRFTTNDLYTVIKGRPTLKNGQPVKLSSRSLNRAWLEFSINLLDPRGYEIYKNLKPQIATEVNEYDFLDVLDGRIEGLIVYKSLGNVWDYAPRAALINGAGGKVVNIGSDSYDFRKLDLIAVVPQIFDQVKETVEASLAS